MYIDIRKAFIQALGMEKIVQLTDTTHPMWAPR